MTIETNIKKRLLKSYMMLMFSALLYTIALHAFIQVAQIFPAGLTSFIVLPSFIWPVISKYVSFIYLAANLPLVIFFWKKNSKKFIYRTLFFLVCQTFFGMIFLFHDVNSSFKNVLNISHPTGETLREKVWPLPLLASIGAFLGGTAIAISWKFGGSTAGTDIISYYYSSKKKVNIGLMVFLVSMSCVIISFILSIPFNHEIRSYWMITLIASIIYTVLVSFIINTIYPKYKKVEVTLISDKSEIISKYLKSNKYNHSWKIEPFKSGYTEKKKIKITTIMFLLESREFMNIIKSLDPDVWISITLIRSIVGNFNTSKLE